MSEADTIRWVKRRVSDEARFLAPLLEKGMCVVDVGCGPGSITLGIAERVAPGWVLGVDTSQDQLATARQLSRDSNIENIRFHIGDATALPICEGVVDVVFAHGLIEHLEAPAIVIEEFSRVLKTGGLVALRSPDWGTTILEPTSPKLLASIDLRNRWQRHNQGEPQAGRKLKGLLHAAGFSDITVRAESMNEEPAEFRDYMYRILRDPELDTLSKRYGWSSSTELSDMRSAWETWSTYPDAFVSSFWCHAIARKII